MNIVLTDTYYTSSLMYADLHILLRKYPFLNMQTIGKSVMEKDIKVVRLGNGPKKVFYFGSIHTNELITTNVLMKFIEDYSDAYINNKELYGYFIPNLFKECSIYVAPMINPDGVDLFNNVIPISSAWYKEAKKISDDFPYIPFPSRMESKYSWC